MITGTINPTSVPVKARSPQLFYLPILLFIHISCWLILKPVAPGSDAKCYAIYAQEILQHNYHLDDSFKSHRYGVIIPAAVFMRWFGESPYVISLWPLICSLLTIAVLFIFLLEFAGENMAISAGLLLALNPVQITFSTALFPDVIVSFFALCLLLTIFRGCWWPGKCLSISFLAVLFFAAGFFTKEIIVLLLPFIVFITSIDLLRRKNVSFWIYFWLLLLSAFAAVLILSKIFLGDFLYFYSLVESDHNVFIKYYDFPAVLKRITYEPLVWLNGQLGYILLIIFSIPSVFSGIKKRGESVESFFAFYFIFLLAMFWMGSSSVHRFVPVLFMDRMWLMLLVPLVVLSASTAVKLFSGQLSQKQLGLLISLFCLFALVNFFQVSLIRGLLFGSFALSVSLTAYLNKVWNVNFVLKTLTLFSPYIILTVYFLARNSNMIFISKTLQ